MSLERLPQDLAKLFSAVKEYDAQMTADHEARKAAGEPLLNPTDWFIDKDSLIAMATRYFKAILSERYPHPSEELIQAQRLLEEDMKIVSDKDFNMEFYASLKESDVPTKLPEDLYMDFYDPMYGVAQHCDDEGC